MILTLFASDTKLGRCASSIVCRYHSIDPLPKRYERRDGHEHMFLTDVLNLDQLTTPIDLMVTTQEMAVLQKLLKACRRQRLPLLVQLRPPFQTDWR